MFGLSPSTALRRIGAAAATTAFLLAPWGARAQGATAPVGAARTVIVLDSVDLTAISTLGELLQARIPGLLVQSGSGSLGAGARVTVRGARSVYGSGDPLLIVDGVRAIGTQRAFALDTSVTVSRLDDVVLEQVATVEVLRGPAATARYGPGASNGAIVVTTRTGASGRGRAYAQAGVAADRTDYPTFAMGVGRSAEGAEVRGCTLAVQASGACTIDRVERIDVFGALPTRVAPAARLGASGGWRTARTATFLAADARTGQGVLRGNEASRGSLRANLDLAPTGRVAIQLRAVATRGTVALRAGDQRSLVDWRPLYENARVEPLEPITHRADRGDLSARATWMPASWLRAHAGAGVSDVAQRESYAQSFVSLDDAGKVRSTLAIDERAAGHDWTATGEAGAAATYGAAGVRATSELALERTGARRTSARLRRVGSTYDGREFPMADAAWSSSRASLDSWAARLAQRLDLFGRLALDGGVRWNRGRGDADRPGALRTAPPAPDASASAAWTVVRGRTGRAAVLRAAYGASSLPLGATLGTAPVGPAPASHQLCVPKASGQIDPGCNTPADPAPRPERTRELEMGADVALGTAAIRVTAFRQRTSDVLMAASLPPSAGMAGLRAAWIGLRNDGVEAELSTRVVARPLFGLAVAASGALARNRVDAPDVGVGIGAGSVIEDGYPLGAVLRPAWRWADANRDGVVAPGEVTVVASEPPTVLGSRLPTRTATLDARLRFGRRVRAAALVEHRGGLAAYGTRPETYMRADEALADGATPLDEQALATLMTTQALTLYDRADFTRLREASLSVSLGRAAGGAELTVAGRNLLTRTRFRGTDPEADVRAARPLAGGGYFSQPLPATVSVRVTRPW
jgi:hypothetical protein